MRIRNCNALTVHRAPQAKMGRYRGIGMPKAKKKKVEQQQEAGPSTLAPDPAEQPPPSPPHRETSAAVRKAPESPERKARRDANKDLCEWLKWQRRARKHRARAKQRKEAAAKLSECMLDQVQRMQGKGRRDPDKELKILHKHEVFMLEEAVAEEKSLNFFWRAELSVCRAQVICKDLQIARLTRMLRAAKKR